MANSRIGLFCLVDGESLTHAFPVESGSTKTIGDLKKFIKAKKANDFQDVDANKLTLWRVSIPGGCLHSAISLDALGDKTELTNPRTLISKLFPESPDDNTYILVQRPKPAAKREHEDDARPSPTRHHPHTLMDIIDLAGLTEKAVVEGEYDLALLDSKDRVALLGFLGQKIDRRDKFHSMSSTARELHGTGFKDVNQLLAPLGCSFPVVETNDLYVRKAYKDLHHTILETFEGKGAPTGNNANKRIVVTGTSGIGKSTFLVYFAIRILAESNDNNPPIIIFQTTRSSGKCYVFGGRSTVRSGDIAAFEPLLNLPDTWYFVDSSPNPLLARAKTVFAYSTKVLFSEARQFKDVEKHVSWHYYVAPWTLEELKTCRASVAGFDKVPLDMMEELYSKIGGVPSYVLEVPMNALKFRPNDPVSAKVKACDRLARALYRVTDPLMLMQSFSQRLSIGMASTHVAEQVAASLTQDARKRMLERLIIEPNGVASGIMFEAYVLHVLREGGYTFEIRDLQTGNLASLDLLQNRKTVHF
ncbi:hypothetical protein BGZ95_001516, partial [Linnemannia exigua]